MMRLILSLLVLLLTAAGAHYVVLTSVPGFVMTKANQMLESQGVELHVWSASPRQTPQTQRVVRPSPDLAYAVCRFDTSNGPVRISAPVGSVYGSLSIFNGQTDNVFVGDLSPGSGFTEVIVSASAPAGSASEAKVDGPGVALIRRLAPSQAEYDSAAALVAGASCGPID